MVFPLTLMGKNDRQQSSGPAQPSSRITATLSLAVGVVLVVAHGLWFSYATAAELRLSTYLEDATRATGHSFLLSEPELGQLQLRFVSQLTRSLEGVDLVLNQHGLERVALEAHTSRIQPQDLAKVAMSGLEISASAVIEPWGHGLGDRLSSSRVLSVDSAGVQGQVGIGDVAAQTANVYGSGSRLYIRGLPRSFGIDRTQNTTVAMAGQPLPHYLSGTATLPRNGLTTATVRRGTQFGFSADLVPSYGGGIEITTACEGRDGRGRITAGAADNSLRNLNVAGSGQWMDGTLIACADLFTESETAPLFSLATTATDRDSRTFQAQAIWTPLPLPSVTVQLTAVDLAADLTEQLSDYSATEPLDLSQLRLSGPSISRNSGTLVSANILRESKGVSWKLNVGALDSRYLEDSKPYALSGAIEDTRYQASFQSTISLGAAGTIAMGVGGSRSRSSLITTERLGSARSSPFYRLIGEANLEASTSEPLSTQHRFATLRYQWQLGQWEFGMTHRFDDFRFDQNRIDITQYVISDDCRIELLIPLINPMPPTCQELYDVGRLTALPTPWRTRSNEWTGELSVSRWLTPKLRVGLVAFEGFRPGGTRFSDSFGTGNYDEEIARTVEASVRYQWGAKSNVSLNVFSTRLVDQQIYVDPLQRTRRDRLILNVGRSKSHGAEFEGLWNLTDALSLSWSVGYLSTAYVDYVPIDVLGSGADISGNRFPGAPSWTGSAQWRYRYSDGLSFGLTLIAADDAFSEVENLSAAIAPGFARLDTSATFTRGRFSATLFVENLNNERYLQTTISGFADVNRFGPSLLPARGRTAGAWFSVSF